MRLTTIYEHINNLAPFSVSQEYREKYGFHDNSGILLDCGEEIKGVLFSLDLSKEAIERAKELGHNCIVTHHPAIFNPLHSLVAGGEGSEVLACAKAGISVISAHLNLDAARGGIDDCLMQGLGGEFPLARMHTLTQGSYGKIYHVRKIGMQALVDKISKTFQTSRIVTYGEKPMLRIASFCGGGMDEQTVEFAIRERADAFVSSDGKHHLVQGLVNAGVNVILLTHYASENYGFTRFYETLKNQWKGTVSADIFVDEKFL